VVKAQILGGGRGFGYFKENAFQGGVHIVDTPEKVREIAGKMCGNTLVTKQSGDDGLPCNKVYIVGAISIEKEFYLSITLDRKAGMPTFIYSTEGGQSIEDVAQATPEKIHKLAVNTQEGLDEDALKRAAAELGLKK